MQDLLAGMPFCGVLQFTPRPSGAVPGAPSTRRASSLRQRQALLSRRFAWMTAPTWRSARGGRPSTAPGLLLQKQPTECRTFAGSSCAASPAAFVSSASVCNNFEGAGQIEC